MLLPTRRRRPGGQRAIGRAGPGGLLGRGRGGLLHRRSGPGGTRACRGRAGPVLRLAAATDLVTRHGTYRRRPATSGAPDDLSLALQQAMNLSEIAVAGLAAQVVSTASRNWPDGWADRLLVVDGPLAAARASPTPSG